MNAQRHAFNTLNPSGRRDWAMYIYIYIYSYRQRQYKAITYIFYWLCNYQTVICI